MSPGSPSIPSSQDKGVLLTRAVALSQKTAQRLAEAGIASVILPMSEPQMLDVPDPAALFAGTFPGEFVFSSPTGVMMFDRWRQGVRLDRARAWCVGEHTAELASKLDFAEIVMGPGDGEALFERIVMSGADLKQPVLHVSAREKSFDFGSRLFESGVRTSTLELYTMVLIEPGHDQLLKSLSCFHDTVIFLYSERTARHFFEVCGNLGLVQELEKTEFVAISPKVASIVPEQFTSRVRFAEKPREESMIEIIA